MAGENRWREIADDLLRRIHDDEFPAQVDGRVKLPTELELQEQYSVGRNTVRDALRWLVEHGAVETERGRGSFVVFRSETLHVTMSKGGVWPGGEGGEGEALVRDAQIEGRRPAPGEVEIGVRKAPPDVARYLRIPEGDAVIWRQQEMFVDKRPWLLQTSYYPRSFLAKAPRLLDPSDIPEGTVAYLGETHGYIQGGYHDEIAVRIPDAKETRFFGLSERASVLVYETWRTAYDEKTGTPFRCTVTIWPADRNRLHYNVGKVPEVVVERPSLPSEDG